MANTMTATPADTNEVLRLGTNVAGLLYANTTTGELTTDENEVLSWLSTGVQPRVTGYFAYEFINGVMAEVCHRF